MMSIQAINSNPNSLFLPSLTQHQRGFGFESGFHAVSTPKALNHSKQCSSRSVCAHVRAGPADKNHGNGGLEGPFGLFLHDLMDQAGIDTGHARAARASFVKEVEKLATCEEHIPPASFSCCLDLARAALEVSAEDDALVSHSPVALPVDSYLERLNSMAMEFARHHMPAHELTPEAVLSSLDNYLYGYKSFQRTSASHNDDVRDCYLNMVLTRRVGNPAMMAIIYSELVWILKSWGVIDFSVDMVAPNNATSLPRPLVKRDRGGAEVVGDSVSLHLLTPESLLIEILTIIKNVYWPWKLLNGSMEGSGFLKAADAANHGIHMSAGAPVESLFATPSNIMGSQVASARAAKHRLQRGIWTSTSFGDMRRALAATERLVLLGIDRKELRDYGILLYHCGLYEPSLSYLNAYHQDHENVTCSDVKEVSALENVLLRLRLILSEQRWNTPATGTALGSVLTDPW